MKLRYKKTGTETAGSRFNIHAMAEVLTGDDTVSIRDLDVFLPALGVWKDMGQAFHDHDLIVDDYNTYFFEPENDAERRRGFRTYGTDEAAEQLNQEYFNEHGEYPF